MTTLSATQSSSPSTRRTTRTTHRDRQGIAFGNLPATLLTAALLISLVIVAYPVSASRNLTITTASPIEVAPPSDPSSSPLVTVNHAPVINGEVDGSVQQLLGESVDLDKDANITEDLLVPGKPKVKVDQKANYKGSVDGTGSASPSDYSVSIGYGATLGHVVRRTDPVTLEPVPEPPAPAGTRHVVINHYGQTAGNFATLLDLTVNQDGTYITVPPGTYGEFTANGHSGFVFGVAGSTEPTVYNLHHLSLNDSSKLKLNGPVILNVRGKVVLGDKAAMGSSSDSSMLDLSIARHGLEIGDQGRLYGNVDAPNGTARIDGTLSGTLVCDRLRLNHGYILKGAGRKGASNQPPQVDAGNAQTITLPVNTVNLTGSATDDGLPKGSTLTFQWSVVSGSGTVIFGNAAALSTTAAFSAPGQYVLQLSASDSQLSSSDTVTITVIPQNHAPVVSAGANQTVTLPNSAILNGVVSDDGLPAGGTLTSLWTKVTGPGTVAFGNPSSPSTTATFSAPGQYVLQLSASDSQLTSSSAVTVTVIPQNQAPVVSAGANQTVTLPNQATLNGAVSDDGLPTGGTLTSLWTKVSGPGTVAFGNLSSPSTTATFSAPGQYVLQLSASDSQLSSSSAVTVTVIPQNQAPVVSAGANQTVTLPNQATLNGTVSDDGLPTGGTLTSQWAKVSGPGTVTFGNPALASTTAAFSVSGNYVLRLTASDTQLSSSADVNVVVIPQNQAPVVSAGADQSVTLPNQATLNGTVSDDGLPTGGPLTSQWTKVSGPGTVTFGNPALTSTTATFSAAGQYVLQLSANDSQLSTSSTVTITVIPQNHAPVVSAGADQSVTLPNQATLNGTVSDDGLPTGGTLTSQWTKVSGPGTVTFGNPALTSTTAAFSAAGQYVLQLSASDSQLSSSSTVTITVIPQNHAPVVSAGADQSVTLPNQATLNGTVSDDGLPTGGTLTSQWTKVSGPGTVTFGNSVLASTTAAFSAPGQYVLQLSASDSQLSSSSTVTITVIPQNQPPVVSAGADQTVTLPSQAALNGTVSDDGLPTGGTLTSQWTKVSGPGTVTFGNPASASTTAKFSASGDYVLRLTASDSLLSSSADVNITALPSTPIVNAGPDQTISLPSAAHLNGSADDGVNPPASLTYQWSAVSGPSAVSFGDASSPVTTASFTEAGTYVLRLTASNGQQSGSDDVTINVSAGCISVPSGLSGWWQGEGNANDASLNNNDGQLINNVSFNAGKVGQAFTFNGTNSVRIPDSPSLRPAAFTLDLWVRFDSLDTPGAGAAGLQFLVFKRNSIPNSFESFALAKLRTNGVDNFVFTMTNATQSALLPSTTAIAAGQFYHVTGSFDGAVMRLYVNGSFETALTPGFVPDYGPKPLMFGSTGESYDGKLAGVLDEVHLFNRALSDTEIHEIFLTSNFGLCGPPSVNAGPDQTISLPVSTVNLNGFATDPSNPGGVLSLNWSVASGPGTVVFGDPSAAVTTASFSVPGTYVLRLRASNGSLSGCDTMVVQVKPPCDQPPAGLVGWWRGEGNAHDSAGQGDGVLVNGTTFTSAEVGQGFLFNGTNSVVIPDSASLRPATFTLDTWVRFDSLDTPGAGAAGLQFLIFKRNSIPNSLESYTLAKLRTNGVDNFVFTMKNATRSALLTSSTAIVPGQFYHVAGTFDGTTMRIYVNGVNETSLVPGFGPDYGTNPVVFGSTGQSFDGKLTGVMDEVHIFNRALSASEVQSIFASAGTGLCAGAMNRMPVFGSGSIAATTIATNMFPALNNKSFVFDGRILDPRLSARPGYNLNQIKQSR